MFGIFFIVCVLLLSDATTELDTQMIRFCFVFFPITFTRLINRESLSITLQVSVQQLREIVIHEESLKYKKMLDTLHDVIGCLRHALEPLPSPQGN